MFMTKQELFAIYKKIKNNEATKAEKDKFIFNLETGCCKPEILIAEFDRRLDYESKKKE